VRRIIRAIPADLCVLARKGERAYLGTAAPFIQRTFEDLVAGEVWNGDHHQFDFFVRHDRTGKLIRLWLTAWLDLASRCLVGWVISEKPNSRTILEGLVHGILPKPRPEYRRLCGLPRRLYNDNGRDYRSATLEGGTISLGRLGIEEGDALLLKGAFQQLDINVTHAIPYNAKAKPIERFFGTLAMDFSPSLPGYCGHDTASKPEQLAEQIKRHERWLKGEVADTPFLTVTQAIELFEAWLFGYHTRAHSELSREGRKLTPIACWELYGKQAEIPTGRSLEFLLMHRELATIQKNGIKIDGHWYWSDELAGRSGQVQVRRARAEGGRAYVFDLRGKFICEAIAGQVIRAGASLDEVRKANEELRRRRRARKRAIEELEKAAPDDALTLLDSIRLEAPPLPAIAQPPAQPEPADIVRRMHPDFDRVPLRQLEAPPEPPQLELAGLGAARPEPAAAPRLRLFASEAIFDELDQEDAAQGGRR